MEDIIEIVTHGFAITGFVLVMMLVVEYLNVRTRGVWERKLQGSRWGQYVLAVFLGVTPGCLGAFAVVAMYIHGSITAGAVVAAMIATSGDAAFVMFAMIPGQAILICAILIVAALLCGFITDVFLGRFVKLDPQGCDGLIVHEDVECESINISRLFSLCHWSLLRVVLCLVMLAFFTSVFTGLIAADHQVWLRLTLAGSSLAALFVVSTVSDHFLKEHLWEHVILKHVAVLFFWIVLALAVMHFTNDQIRLFRMATVCCRCSLIPGDRS